MDRAVAKSDSPAHPTVWVFFDEINTCTELTGRFKELVADRRYRNKRLPDNLIVLAACNPKNAVDHRLQPTGSKGHTEEKQQLMGSPDDAAELQGLYQVSELPDSLTPFKWPLLDMKMSEDYVSQLLKNHEIVQPRQRLLAPLSRLVCTAQRLLSALKEDDISVGSLRDASRVMLMYRWFLDRPVPWSATTKLPHSDKATLLALSHCYVYRLKEPTRLKFWRLFAEDEWMSAVQVQSGQQLVDLCRDLRNDYLDLLEWPSTVAKTETLMDSLFVILTSVLAGVPVIAVGHPGTGKTLAVDMVEEQLKADHQNENLIHRKYQRLLQESGNPTGTRVWLNVHVTRFQCTATTRPAEISSAFTQARSNNRKHRQEMSHTAPTTLYVVFLDEVGLAEQNTAQRPLKVLHKELERDYSIDPDSTAEERKQVERDLITQGDEENADITPPSERQLQEYLRVSFVGLSNTALDAAKMSRAVCVQCSQIKEEGLKIIARTILTRRPDSQGWEGCSRAVAAGNEKVLNAVLQCHMNVVSAAQPRGYWSQFWGNRDLCATFNSLSRMNLKATGKLAVPNLQAAPLAVVDAVLRNLSGRPMQEKESVEYQKALTRLYNSLAITEKQLEQAALTPMLHIDCNIHNTEAEVVLEQLRAAHKQGQGEVVDENSAVNGSASSLSSFPVISNGLSVNSYFASRHLLILTQGHFSYSMLRDVGFQSIVSASVPSLTSTQNHVSASGGSSSTGSALSTRVVFDSVFPDDLGSTAYSYDTLGSIKQSVQSACLLLFWGVQRTAGALYELLNQQYKFKGTAENMQARCTLAINSYQLPCTVHPLFKVVFVIPAVEVQHMTLDPPFLSRLEKQADFSTRLLPWPHLPTRVGKGLAGAP